MSGVARGSDFGTLLRDFRVAAGLSQEALAERATMSADAVSALERGINKAPRRETLALLLRALGLPPEERAAIEAAAVRPSRPRSGVKQKACEHRLPRPLSPLFGRARDLEEIADHLHRSRIVTLIGAGGVGKTRLAVECGHVLRDRYRDGVWFVDLAPLRESGDVASAIGNVLGVRPAGSPPLDAAVEALKRKQALLILDNCEHVAAGARAAAEAITASCPGVQILATSRQPLEIGGEQRYRVASLDAQASRALFVDIALRVDASFAPSPAEAAVMERIVTRLDGIALAIELAAARVRLLSLDQIERLLSERFRILSGSGRVARQQTMRAAVDWSYDLLSSEERTLFDRLGIFAGDFSLEAAVAVCSGEGVAESSVLDLLGSLVDKSLLTITGAGKARWFRLLETIRAYALEKLGASGESFGTRHAEYYYGVAKAARASANWSEMLEPEFENVRCALERTIDDGRNVALGIRLMSELREYVLLRGLAAETARRAERALQSEATLSTPLRAVAWELLSAMLGDLLVPGKALEAAVQSVALYERLDEPKGLSRAMRGRGIAHLRLGMYAQALDDLQRALDLSRGYGDRLDEARALGSLAVAYEMTGRLEEGRRVTAEVLQMARELGDDRIVWVSVTNLAEADFALGEVSRAVEEIEDLLASEMAGKNVRLRAHARANLAGYLVASEDATKAVEAARAAIADAREAGDIGMMSCAIGHLAAAVAPYDPQNAARLLGFVDGVFGSGYKREHTERYTYDRLVRELRSALSEERIAVLASEGATLSEEEAIGVATLAERAAARRRKRDPLLRLYS